jgi:hypothetical protein
MTKLAHRRLHEMTKLAHQQFSTLVLPSPFPSRLPPSRLPPFRLPPFHLQSPLPPPPSPLPPPLVHLHVQHPRQLRPEHRRPRRLHPNLTVPHSVRERRIDLLLHLLLCTQSLRLLLLGLLGHSLRSPSEIAIRCNQVQSGAIRCNPSQSGLLGHSLRSRRVTE